MEKWTDLYIRADKFNVYLNNLYYSGKLKLSELQSFRHILNEIVGMFDRLKFMSVFGYVPKSVKRDLNRLESELTLMEYNVSLISFGNLTAA
jgi:hypothetical protein